MKSVQQKLRKEVCGDELDYHRFIVEGKYFIDPWDKKETKLLIAINEADEAVDAFQSYPRCAGPYIYDELYFSQKLINALNLPINFVILQH